MAGCDTCISSHPAESHLERPASLSIPGIDGKHTAYQIQRGFHADSVSAHTTAFCHARESAGLAFGAVLVLVQQGWQTVPSAWIHIPCSAFHYVSAERETLLFAACVSHVDGSRSRGVGELVLPPSVTMGQTCVCHHSAVVRH